MDESKKITVNPKRVLKAVGAITVIALSYAIGCKITTKRFGDGIQRCWDVDPTLRDHMWDAAVKVCKGS